MTRSLLVAVWAMSLALAAGAAAGCSRAAGSDADMRVAWTLHPDPPVVGTEALDLVLADPSGRPIHGARVRVEGNMSHPGMAPSIAQAQELEPGHYRAALELTMAGDWFLLVEAGLADGREVHRTVRIPAVMMGDTPKPPATAR